MNKQTFLQFGAAGLAAVLLCNPASASSSATATEERRVQRTYGAASIASGDITTRMETKRATYLGVEVAEIPAVLAAQLKLPEGQGLVVNFVQPESPAAQAGLQRHDVLTKLDNQILIDGRQLSVLVRGYEDGAEITLTRLRAGTEGQVTVALASREMPVTRLFETGFQHSMPYPSGEYNRFYFNGARAASALPGTPSRVMIFRPKTNVVYTGDDGSSLELIVDDERQMLKARDASGKVIFDGPVTTSEEREALPDELREQLEKLESMQIQPPPPASVPPAPPLLHHVPHEGAETVESRSAARADITALGRCSKTDIRFFYTPTVVAL
jgi:hypothetical protein